eukprot:TRINITY_DN3676_c0_g4_i3.p1 TRINITY_DN3676_c0_g4~~TRINITY_DN3676_c0_g4_i3.p1  ORF type:complete len:335 (-),score=102.35 TRINITY_DN3676_c0_g4_i3:25-927(-)
MEAYKKIYPEEFYRKFLVHHTRPDGRGLTAIRKTVVTAGSITSAHGSAFVKIGSTSVVCGIKGEVGKKTSGKHMAVNVELLPLCSSQFPHGRPSDQAQVYGELLNRLVDGIINNSEFDIPETELSWYLYVDIYCLDYNGNVFDATLISLLTALTNLSLPSVHVNTGEQVIATKTGKGKKLTLLRYPISLSFGMVDSYIICDPNSDEENLQQFLFTIIVDETGNLLSVVCPGSGYAGINSVGDGGGSGGGGGGGGGDGGSGVLDSGPDLKLCIERTRQRAKNVFHMIMVANQEAEKILNKN